MCPCLGERRRGKKGVECVTRQKPCRRTITSSNARRTGSSDTVREGILTPGSKKIAIHHWQPMVCQFGWMRELLPSRGLPGHRQPYYRFSSFVYVERNGDGWKPGRSVDLMEPLNSVALRCRRTRIYANSYTPPLVKVAQVLYGPWPCGETSCLASVLSFFLSLRIPKDSAHHRSVSKLHILSDVRDIHFGFYRRKKKEGGFPSL
jgi:hypothetical protein